MLGIRKPSWFHLPHIHLAELSGLPLAKRLTHRLARRHTFGFLLGGFMMVFGSIFAKGEVIHLPHIVCDVLGYGIHGIGLIPFALHAEPFWRILGFAATAAEGAA